MTDYSNQSDHALIQLAQGGDAAALECMAVRHDALVKYVAKRYLGRGREYDDLHQLGRIGLIKAIKNFDVGFSVKFSTYAVPVILGEIRRFLRDDGQVHVTRSIRENAARIQKLLGQRGESPPVREIAEALGMEQDDVVLALDSLKQVRSLSEPVTADGTVMLQDTLGTEVTEPLLEQIELDRLLSLLPDTERNLIVRRYFLEQTQSRIAAETGMSQVQVSRMESKILKRLRELAG